MTNVIFIMIDGLRPDALQIGHTPTLDAFLQRAAYTLNARSVFPSITLPCHTSIFHSVPPDVHGIIENIWTPNPGLRGLVEHLKDADKRSAFFYNWDTLRDLSRPSSLAYGLFMDTAYDLDGDPPLAEAALPHLVSRKYDFSFVYLGTVDTLGHMHGWMSEQYLQQVALVDGVVGKLLAALPEDFTVLIHSDHGGGGEHHQMHGTEHPHDMTIPWMIAGPSIKHNHVIERPVSLLDTAPTIAHLLGVKPAEEWQGRAVDEIFNA